MVYHPDSPILGPSAPDAAAWCARAIMRQPHGEYTATDVQTIVAAYAATCRTAGLDVCMVVAQMIHETGNLSSWWAQRPRRNPAGIGVTGRTSSTPPTSGSWAHQGACWLEGCVFQTWADDAIPAHIGRLLAYALPPGAGTTAQQALIMRALLVRPMPLTVRGIAAATGWQALNGRWAVPGTDYAQRIAAIATTLG